MTIDQHGRQHHAAGAPAGVGGQYAKQSAPAAAATLEARRTASYLRHAYEAQVAIERSYGARALATDLRERAEELRGYTAIDLEATVSHKGNSWANSPVLVLPDGTTVSVMNDQKLYDAHIGTAHSLAAHVQNISQGDEIAASGAVTRTVTDGVVRHRIRLDERGIELLEMHADVWADEARGAIEQSIRPGGLAIAARDDLREMHAEGEIDESAVALQFDVDSDRDGEYLAQAWLVDAEGNVIEDTLDGTFYEIANDYRLREQRREDEAGIEAVGHAFQLTFRD